MLQPFGQDIWIAEGPTVVAAAGFRYPTRMAVIRLADASLFLWSPIALDDALCAEVDALGPVAHLVAPNSLHHVFIGDWKRAYPAARLWAAPGLAAKRGDLVFDGELGDEPPSDWAGEIDQAAMRGNAITTEVVFFHRASGAAIFTDLIQQFPESWFSGWRAFVAKWDLMVTPEPTVPRKFRVAFTKREPARAALRRILAWPVEKLLMAHGTPVTGDARGVLARVFAWFKP